MGIRLKVTVFVCAMAVAFVAIVIGMGYRYSFRSLDRSEGENYRHMAQLLANAVVEIIDNEMNLVKANAGAGILRDAVKDSNIRYQADETASERSLADMDKKWAEAPDDQALVKGYTENKASLSLRAFMEDAGSKAISILATDSLGGLVAATNKPSDFYSADKDWWKEAYDGGRGKVIVGDIVFDKSANVWALPFIAPIKDEAGGVIGIYRALVDISAFFGPLENFELSKTGNAALVDDKAYLVFCPNTKPFTNKFCEYGELQRILQSDKKWGTLNSAYLHTRGAIAAFAEVAHPLFLKKGIIWRVFVMRDANEIFKPLAAFIVRMSLVGVVIVILLVLAAFLFGDMLAKPIKNVVDGIAHIGTGDLGFRVKAAKGGGEINKLANSFNEMAQKLQEAASSVAREKGELDKRDEELKKLEQLKSDFVSALSQLRIGAFIARQEVESVLGEPPGELDNKHRDIMKAADKNMDKLVRKMDNLIDMAKIDTGKLDMKMKPASLKEILRRVVFVYEPKIREKALTLKIDIPKDEACIYADPDRMAQVFSILLDNAVRLTEKGYIEISVKTAKDEIECHVTDSGPGISRENINRIFERFQRIGRGVAGPEEDGLGLGLSIARGIIKMHGGSIRVESEPNKGAKFIFRLPRCEKA